MQDGEILAFLTVGDVFGDAAWRDNKIAKSAVHVRALTYCDIHMGRRNDPFRVPAQIFASSLGIFDYAVQSSSL